MIDRKRTARLLFVLSVLFSLSLGQAVAGGSSDFEDFDWSLLTADPGWAPRAGLQVVELRNEFYLMGGRTPIDPAILPVPGASTIWSDVWKSSDLGRTWRQILPTDTPDAWPARAYFQAVQLKGRMFVLGGQNFKLVDNPFPGGPPLVPDSDFFNDVWSSRDGVNWIQHTAEAPWAGRAGLSAAAFDGAIFVMGGSFNDDPAIIGGPPERVYFNDVWKSTDGENWELMTEAAPWAPRAGGIAVVKGDYLYLVGGEDGFTCLPGLRCPPYYNDVWRTADGANWELVTAEAPWPPRPGHQCLVLNNHFVLFGGFGLSPDPSQPFLPSNPMDVWVSKDGVDWIQVSDSPWNATSPEDIKYDFDAVVAAGGAVGGQPAIFTFGGDRETFDFTDPDNHLRVDDEVWRFAPPLPPRGRDEMGTVIGLHAAPNPFNPMTAIKFGLLNPERVTLEVYDLAGRHLRTLIGGDRLDAGDHQAVWDGNDQAGKPASAGVYFYRLQAGSFLDTKRMLLLK
jgi:hypothetical protein